MQIKVERWAHAVVRTKMSEKSIAISYHRMCMGKTLRQVADRFAISRERVRQIEEMVEKKIQELQACGVLAK